MKYKSSKQKKRRKARRSWLADVGSILTGIAAVCEIVFKIVVYLSGR